MAVVLRIEHGDLKYQLKSLKLLMPEYIAIQRATGLLSTEFEAGVKDPRGNVLAIAALLWIVRRRSGDYVKWPEFESSLGDLSDVRIEVVDETPAEEKTVDDSASAEESVSA